MEGARELFPQGWPGMVIFSISASQIAKIIGMSQ
jgi:hypothetical protein